MSYAREYPEAKEWILLNAEGNAAGHLLLDRRAQSWRIVDLAVAQAHRGQGMGMRALHQCQRQAADAGCDLALQVAPGNPARRLYERLGFYAVREDAVTVEMVWNAAEEEQPSGDVLE
jgi:ribosomal protein S18 acetylase RimI-like enzyme